VQHYRKKFYLLYEEMKSGYSGEYLQHAGSVGFRRGHIAEIHCYRASCASPLHFALYRKDGGQVNEL